MIAKLTIAVPVAIAFFASSCCEPLPPPKVPEPPVEEAPPLESLIDPFAEAEETCAPVAKVDNVQDEHWGVTVDDPYRYLEKMDDPYVQDWFKGQADCATEVLHEIPGREQLLARIKELDKNKKFRIFSIVRHPKGAIFYKKLGAGENIPKLYWQARKTAKEKLLVDPAALKVEDDQHYSMGAYKPDPKRKHVVYGLAQGGSEETTYRVMDIKSGELLDDSIDRIETAYNSPQWSDDGKGFFYSRRQELPEGAPATEIYKNTKVYYHRLGTSAADDKLIAAAGHSDEVPLKDVDFPSIYMPAKSQFAILKIKHGDSNPLTLYAAPKRKLLRKNIPWVKICDASQQVDDYAVYANRIYLRTSHEASRYKVVMTKLRRPDFAEAETVVPEGDYVIDSVATTKDALYVGIIDGGFNKIIKSSYKKPAPEVLDLPGGAAGYLISANQKIANPLIYTNAWTKGSKIYEYDAKKGTFTDTGMMPAGKFDDVKGFTSKEVEVKSHDGVMVPMSIVYPEDIELDGSNPTLVYGYGSYGISIGVAFRATRLAWLERGGVVAFTHVRGGGEKGKDWQLAGAMEYMISEGYTSSEKVAGMGVSAGGILIGRTITERPELLRAALIGVGLLDAVRAETTTNGVPNIMEFGTVEKEDEFEGLLEMSAYHHVEDGVAYPAVLLTHGINDPRVEPWMSGKMAARLQAATSSDRPIVFRVDYAAGHGVGSKRDQVLEELADDWAFLLWQFGETEAEASADDDPYAEE
jgi:prolyl oligopeptidase